MMHGNSNIKFRYKLFNITGESVRIIPKFVDGQREISPNLWLKLVDQPKFINGQRKLIPG